MELTLQATLASVVQQLASFFGTTTDMIMQNAPMWLAKYGWFTMMHNLPVVITLWIILIGALLFIIYSIGIYLKWKKNSIVLLNTMVCLVISLLIFGSWFGQCAIAPEFYGLNALINIFNSGR